MTEQLPQELLRQVIAYLDAPSAACLALTSRRNYAAVISTCKVSRLEDVCPRDVLK